MSTERIVAAVVDTKLLTLYREDGSTIEIPQGDPRVRGIIEQVMPVVQSGQTAIVDLSRLPNAYKEFEEKASGLVKLFRVAKKAVSSIFADPDAVQEPVPEVEPGVFGVLPNSNIASSGPLTGNPMMDAVDEILANAESVSAPSYKEADTTADHTMIAVVEDKTSGKKTVIPGVEDLKEQFGYSSKLGSTKAMETFLKRLATVIESRPHSVQDLLRFLEKGDLPIADDGCIVAYKRLFTRQGHFVDPHTKRVTQRPGSYVRVDDSLVDMSRRNECSNGLHIGRRGYMGGFFGDAIFICKIAPEDVMVVPHNDPNKVRVRGYHVIAQVNKTAFNLICSNRPATSDAETVRLLSDIIAGKHKPADHEVRITEQQGGGLVITPMQNGVKVPHQKTTEKIIHTALDDETITPKVDVKAVSQQVQQQKGSSNRMDQVKALMQTVQTGTKEQARMAALDILELKKRAKVGWDTLGIDQASRELLSRVANPEPNATTKAAIAESKEMSAKPAASAPAGPLKEILDRPTPETMNRKDQVSELINRMNNTTAAPGDRAKAAQDLLDLRKKAKVGWPKLDQPKMTDDTLRSFISQMNTSKATPAPTPKAPAKQATPKAVAKVKAKPEPQAKQPKGKVALPTDTQLGISPNAAHARKLFNEKAWGSLLSFKRLKKKSWTALGFTSKEESEIKLHIGD